jgi:hypothetical protein
VKKFLLHSFVYEKIFERVLHHENSAEVGLLCAWFRRVVS